MKASVESEDYFTLFDSYQKKARTLISIEERILSSDYKKGSSSEPDAYISDLMRKCRQEAIYEFIKSCIKFKDRKFINEAFLVFLYFLELREENIYLTDTNALFEKISPDLKKEILNIQVPLDRLSNCIDIIETLKINIEKRGEGAFKLIAKKYTTESSLFPLLTWMLQGRQLVLKNILDIKSFIELSTMIFEGYGERTHPMNFYKEYSDFLGRDTFFLERKHLIGSAFSGFDFNQGTVEALENTFSQALIEAYQAANSKQRDYRNGLWEFDDYVQHCKKTKTEVIYSAQGCANSKYWHQEVPFVFKLKFGAKPSEAIVAFIKGFTICNSGQFMIACQYYAVLKVFGEEKFNAFFDYGSHVLAIPQFPITFLLQNPAQYFFKMLPKSTPGNLGEFCIIDGPRLFSSRGDVHVLCVGKNNRGENLFLGLNQETALTKEQYINVLRDKGDLPSYVIPSCYPSNNQQQLCYRNIDYNLLIKPDFEKIFKFGLLSSDEMRDLYFANSTYIEYLQRQGGLYNR